MKNKLIFFSRFILVGDRLLLSKITHLAIRSGVCVRIDANGLQIPFYAPLLQPFRLPFVRDDDGEAHRFGMEIMRT